ncbi:MAG: aryl-sulfate sulfotransferase [Saprospiraceae bacterium]|nr:aryl-sulfate sulfotransferase [Saprospiraceae bacterium]
MRSALISIGIALSGHLVVGQQTVGLFAYEEGAYDGYTLFAPTGYEHTYLIDNCGMLINEWISPHTPGMSAYLLPDGDLLRAARISSTFNGGGSGGRIERYGWDGEIEWHINYSSGGYHQHHDIEPLPNGNLLVIAWERRTIEEAVAAGRKPELLTATGLWPEHIVEVKPVGEDDFQVVWIWHLWDHLVQDFDSTRANFGDVAAHPELVDLNYVGPNGPGADWIHLNSINYNPVLDQILVSSRHFNEIWIIDHSTTTEEAAGHSGGNSGKGGDLLYRWGNPEVYRRGTAEDRRLFGQHDARWIEEGRPGAGHIMVYNNGFGRPTGTYSSVDVLVPPLVDNGTYAIEVDSAFGPDTAIWTYSGMPDNAFFSNRISGGQRQPNGNTLVCVGTQGRFFEIDTAGQIVWDYQSPVGTNGPVPQGETAVLDDVFKIERYPPDFPGFAGRDLTPMEPVELDPWPSDCMIFSDTITIVNGVATDRTFRVFPNPAARSFRITAIDAERSDVQVRDLSGRIVFEVREVEFPLDISSVHWPAGVYLVGITLPHGIRTFKLIKQ